MCDSYILSQYRAAQPTAVTAVTAVMPEAVVNIVPASVASFPPSREQGQPIPSLRTANLAPIDTGAECNNDIEHQLVIRVFSPTAKLEYKSYLLNLKGFASYRLRSLKEEILEQLGKKVICFDLEFDVGYMKGTQRICFSQSDDVAAELWKMELPAGRGLLLKPLF